MSAGKGGFANEVIRDKPLRSFAQQVSAHYLPGLLDKLLLELLLLDLGGGAGRQLLIPGVSWSKLTACRQDLLVRIWKLHKLLVRDALIPARTSGRSKQALISQYVADSLQVCFRFT